tara:strand:- start:1282 stop:1815 length:534 start_codon:yes stop_codon:yes gene_type:complete
MFNQQQHVYYDNFLSDVMFEELSEVVESNSFDWYWRHTATRIDNQYNMYHILYEKKGTNEHQSGYYNLFENVLTSLVSKLGGIELIRAKLVMHLQRNERQYTGLHHDIRGNTGGEKYDVDAKIFIFNFTTCNGGTVIGETEVKSKANSGIFFSNKYAHQGIIQSDKPRRILMNIVFY